MDAEMLTGMITDLNELTSDLMDLKPLLAVKSGEVANKLIAYLESLSKVSPQAKPLK